MTTSAYIEQIREHIKQDELDAALQQLQLLLHNSPKLDEAIHQTGRFTAIRTQIRLGTVSHADATLEENKIRFGLLELLREVETQETNDAIRAEVERVAAVAQKPFNEALTKSLIESISAHSSPAKRFAARLKNIEHWERQARISDKAKEIVAYSFVGIVGIQLSKLLAIGKEEFSEIKQKKYIQKCVQIAAYSLDLVNFVLLSKLWDIQKESSQLLEAKIHELIIARFDKAFAPSMLEHWQLLQSLYRFFKQHQLPFPIKELPEQDAAWQSGSYLEPNLQALHELSKKVDNGKYQFLDCFEAEQQLADFFKQFAFLVNYNMASIKNIGYREVRNDTPIYLHRFNALGIDSKANVDAEKIKGIEGTVHTDAVLFYRGNDYRDNINLYPFVIDYNTLTSERGAKICFFQCINLGDDSLEYVFLEDNSTINIEKREGLHSNIDLGELMMMDNDQQNIFNLNCVVDGFEQAKRDILAEGSW